MKKSILTLLFAFPLLLNSCSDEKENINTGEETGTGILRIGLSLDEEILEFSTRATPTTDFADYYLVLEGPTPWSGKYPTGGVIEDLEPGNYTVTLSSHQLMPGPAFDVQFYSLTTDTVVTEEITTPLQMKLIQANAGVCFVYDDSLDGTPYENVIPKITGADGYLEYSGENRNATGYFAPGELTVSFTVDGETVLLGGEESRKLNVEEKQLWEITIRMEEEGGGTRTISTDIYNARSKY